MSKPKIARAPRRVNRSTSNVTPTPAAPSPAASQVETPATSPTEERWQKRRELLARVYARMGLRGLAELGNQLPPNPSPGLLLAGALGLDDEPVVPFGLVNLKREIGLLRAALGAGTKAPDDGARDLAFFALEQRVDVLAELARQNVEHLVDEVLVSKATCNVCSLAIAMNGVSP